VPNYPVTILSNYSDTTSPWFGPAGLMGLGPESTLLKHLLDNQVISTRSFGLYMGTSYEQSNGAINGSLTLGGYDSGRFEGEVHNYTLSPKNAAAANSPFKVTVQQMTLNDQSGGNTTDLLTEAFDAYITTSQYHLNLPLSVQQQFSDVTGATPSGDDLNVLRLPDDFDASLTITLDSGLQITYDADWLRNMSNNSPISTGTITNDSNSTVNLLGSAFLSNVYIIANYDSNPPAFHLAQALPHGPYVFTEPLCADSVPTPAPVQHISSFGASGLTGAILGGVIGGLGLGFALFWLLRKHLQRRMWRKQALQQMKGKGLDDDSTLAGSTTSSGRGKGSPATIASELERGGSNEMATFAFDFNSQGHQAYANYLNGETQQQSQQQSQPTVSRTYSQFIKQISRENLASSRDNLTINAAPPSKSNTPPHLERPFYPPVLQRSRPGTSDTYETPITPATGVPLLFYGERESEAQNPVVQTSKHGPFHPLTLSHSNISLNDSSSTLPWSQGQAPVAENSSFGARQAKMRGLEVQTEFAPPPRSATDRVVRKAVAREKGKEGGVLKKMFPPPP
jgi:hypothetical protein